MSPATVEKIQRQQEAAMPRGDLAPYAGKWIAVRDGEIVASDISLDRLRQHPEVRPSDVCHPIADAESGVFVL